MLSKTADTNPRPSAVGHDAAGSLSTGINDAHRMSESRKMVPSNALGSRLQSGLRMGAVTRIATHTAAPMNGNLSERWLTCRLTTTVAAIAAANMAATTATRPQSIPGPTTTSFTIGE